ncbi:UNVERIFIED_CONTAM: hypothetical protein FKN15_051659 [Acipenser sinensis]
MSAPVLFKRSEVIAFLCLLGDQTKALIGQLILFNQILGELREDIREQVKEMALIRNTILECQICGFHESRSRCTPSPCFQGVPCMETYEYPGYRCGACPEGMMGNGTHCKDIDECSLAQPCFPGSRCVNMATGFRCEACPPGYWGPELSGVGVQFAKTHRQGSYKCGQCLPGFVGNQMGGCLPQKSCSSLTFDPCDVNAYCVMQRNGDASCACNVGYAGNGHTCGPDTDIDGYPDDAQPCIDNHKHCRQDNCRYTPNSGQEDADNDGIGDQCDEDADGDGIKNVEDNCRLVPNKDQQNSDTDSFGDACDNCPNVPNIDQRDTDSSGEGDACDNDIDGDGSVTEATNGRRGSPALPTLPCGLPFTMRTDHAALLWLLTFKELEVHVTRWIEQLQPFHFKIQYRAGARHANAGRRLEATKERILTFGLSYSCCDGDGHQDTRDNCPEIPNSSQLDSDNDGIGDDCDDDDDNDGIPDFGTQGPDNCRLIHNPNQKDTDVMDVYDVCPESAEVTLTDFRAYQTVVLDPEGDAQIDPNWVVLNQEVSKALLVYWLRLLTLCFIGRMKLYEGSGLVADSGVVIDTTMRGGRLGVFCFSQENIIWSNLRYRCNGNASSTNDTISTIQTTSSSKTVDTPTTPTESSTTADNTNSISTGLTIPPHTTDSTTEHNTNVTTGTTIKPHVTDSTTEHSTNVTTGTTIKPHATDSTTEHNTNVTTGTTIKPHATDSTTEHNTNVTTGTTIKPHATDSTTEHNTNVTTGTTIKPHATDSTTEHNTNVTTGTTIKPHATDSTTEHNTNVTTGTTIKPHATDSTTEHNTNVTTGTTIKPHATDSTTEHNTNVTTGTTTPPHATDSTTEHNTNVTTGTTTPPHATDSTTEHNTNVTTGTTIKPHATDSTTEHNTNVTTGTTIKPHATDSTTEHSTNVTTGTTIKPHATDSTTEHSTSVTTGPTIPPHVTDSTTEPITSISPGNHSTTPIGTETSTKVVAESSTSAGGTTVTPNTSFYISFKITNKIFNSSLTEINSDYYKALEKQVLQGVVTSTDAMPPSSQSGSEVPGWGIALLVLAALILLILLIILILMMIYCCMRRRRGQFNVFGIGGYYSMNDSAGYPMYSTHTHYEVPNGGSTPYNTDPGRSASVKGALEKRIVAKWVNNKKITPRHVIKNINLDMTQTTQVTRQLTLKPAK